MTLNNLPAVDDRLASVERSLRRQKRFTAALAVALVAITTVAAADKLNDVSGGAFRLLDRQGKTRTTVAFDEAGNPAITFLTPEGIVTRVVGPSDDTPARLAELERLLRALPRVAPGYTNGLAPLDPPLAPLNELERQSQQQQQDILNQQRLAAQAADQQRMDNDLRRREQERWDIQRGTDRLSKP